MTYWHRSVLDIKTAYFLTKGRKLFALISWNSHWSLFEEVFAMNRGNKRRFYDSVSYVQ